MAIMYGPRRKRVDDAWPERARETECLQKEIEKDDGRGRPENREETGGFDGLAGDDADAGLVRTDEEIIAIAGANMLVQDQQVRVDFNHPLAGREIVFETRIIEVTNPPSEEAITGQ